MNGRATGPRAMRVPMPRYVFAVLAVAIRTLCSRREQEVVLMNVERLVRADWASYCDRISRGIEQGQRAELELVSLEIGDHIEAKWLPIHGLVYEPKADLLEVALEDVDHLIAHPKELLVETSPRGIVGLEIVGGDDVRRIVKLLEPLSLPPRGRRRARTHR